MREQRIIALTGTPGTGKSVVSKLLKKKCLVVDLNKAIKKQHLYLGYDKSRKCYIADMKKIKKYIISLSKKRKNYSRDIIIDSHLSHLLPSRIINRIIILRCTPRVLEKRLKKKRWAKKKINENVESEFIGIISWESRQNHKLVYDLDTTRFSIKRVKKEVEALLNGKAKKGNKRIDWIARLK